MSREKDAEEGDRRGLVEEGSVCPPPDAVSKDSKAKSLTEAKWVAETAPSAVAIAPIALAASETASSDCLTTVKVCKSIISRRSFLLYSLFQSTDFPYIASVRESEDKIGNSAKSTRRDGTSSNASSSIGYDNSSYSSSNGKQKSTTAHGDANQSTARGKNVDESTHGNAMGTFAYSTHLNVMRLTYMFKFYLRETFTRTSGWQSSHTIDVLAAFLRVGHSSTITTTKKESARAS